MISDLESKPSLNQPVSKYAELLAGIVALVGSSAVFFFFMETHGDIVNPGRIYITIKQEYSSWAWGIFSLSSVLYYFIRSNKQTTSVGYMNPILKWMLELARIVPLFGLTLSLINGTGFMLESQLWSSVIRMSYNFLNTIFILFVAAHFGAGIIGVRRFWTENR